jgi:UDP-N-acetylmuramate--alanine ligase
VIADYAHLPEEVRATIATARQISGGRTIALFQPHRVTRTEALASDFASAFDGLDALAVTDIYTSGEANPKGLTGEIVVERILAHEGAPPVTYVGDLAAGEVWLRERSSGAAVVLVMGAGDVDAVASRVGGA